MKALIMAGGKGTRLIELTKDMVPKPMIMLNNKPLLQYAIDNLIKYNIDEIYISVGYQHNKIIDYFGNGEQLGVKINYIIEEEPLGSGGALYYLKGKVKGDFVVCMGDALFDIDIPKMLQYHKDNNADITMLTHPNSHPYDSDLIICDDNNRVVKIDKKNNVRNFYYKNNVNAGFFIVNANTLAYFDVLKKVNMEGDFINQLINDNKNVFAYHSTEYIKDVGTPKRYYGALEDIKNGLVDSKNLENKQKAIFLDRDGTINKYNGFITKPEALQLIDDASKAISMINNSKYLAIIISNQPVVARGECTFAQENEIMNKLETDLGKEGAYVDAIYYCPHHPHKGYEGEVKELKIVCDCRKPSIGLINKAVLEYNLDLKDCYIIGDTNTDIMTGINAGIPQIRVPSQIVEDTIVEPTYKARNLVDAVQFILNKE